MTWNTVGNIRGPAGPAAPVVRASARYGCAAFTTSATPMTVQILPFTSRAFDDASAVNGTTGVWTCQFAGVYTFSFHVGLNISPVQHNLYFYKNGAQTVLNARGPFAAVTGTVFFEIPAIYTERCVAGDTVDCRLAVNQASVVIRTGTFESMFNIAYQHT